MVTNADHPPPKTKVPYGFGRHGWALLAAIALAALASAFYVVSQARWEARLMRADPDLIANDPDLQGFALSYAAGPYKQHCAACHGERMQGDRRKGIPNLADPEWLYGEGRTVEIEHTILYGIRAGNARTWNLADMPAFAREKPYRRYEMMSLTPGDIRDVVEFLLVTGGKEGDLAAAERGGSIFADKGQCFDCHSSDGRGDNAIGAPNLLDDVWLYGSGKREEIYASVARGLAGACPAWFQQLNPVTIRALAVTINAAWRKNAPLQKAQSPDTAPPSAKAG